MSCRKCLLYRIHRSDEIPKSDDVASHLANSKQRDELRLIETDFSTTEVSSSPTSAVTQNVRVSAEDDNKNEHVAKAMSLLLAARERVLTLSEQRVSYCLHSLLFVLTEPRL